MKKNIFLVIILLILNIFSLYAKNNTKHPNVILILTDDQGNGDLSCHENPWLKTPNIDKFYAEAVRLTDFHVSPLCTPTRGAIMTGRYPINNGVWATYKGRDAMHDRSTTMAEIFQQNGYITGIFGKWHLGDNYPVRPTDCGFDVAIHHKAGGVGELSDYWGNSYFDDIYYVNNVPKQFKGYCTDVWFNEATKFIKENMDKPFFVYLPTNAPHDPFIVDPKYATPYKYLVGDKIYNAEFYGMIANIDENFGKFDQFLKSNGLDENTIVIYMTDNGSSGGISPDLKLGWDMGFRGRKMHHTEGGHRVPFFIRWPNGNINGGWDIDALTAHVDMIPTLANLCGIKLPKNMALDGVDFSPLLEKEKTELEKRTVFIHNRQDWRPPYEEFKTCLMTEEWRLVNGNELYRIKEDSYQMVNLLDQNKSVVDELLQQNNEFVKKAKLNVEYQELPVSVVGNEQQLEIKLTIQHAIGEGPGIWKSQQVADGMKNSNNTHAIQVEKDGKYLISCCRWPKECPGEIWGVPAENPKGMYQYNIIKPRKARISIANQIHEKEIKGNEMAIEFEVNLQKGKTFLVNDFIEGKEKYGVYYTYIKKLDDN